MKLLSVFSKLSDNAKNIAILVSVSITLVTFIGGTIHSCNQANEIEALNERNDDLANTLADNSSLVEKYRDENGTLSEKYSRIGEDFSSFRRTARQEDAEKSRTILAYQSSVQNFKLENQKLRGRIERDSAGNATGFSVDTTTVHYSLSGFAYFNPPALEILLLQVMDSSFIVFSEDKEGYVYGEIGHSNPYIYDSGASFQISLSRNAASERSPYGWMLGLGPVYSSSLKWNVAFLGGAKLYGWGIGAFIAQDTRGILILHDF